MHLRGVQNQISIHLDFEDTCPYDNTGVFLDTAVG